MLKFWVIAWVITGFQLGFALTASQGDTLYIQGKYQLAAQAYLKQSQEASAPAKHQLVFQGVRALVSTQDDTYIQLADQHIGGLLAELETESPLFYKTLLLRSIISFKLGRTSKALLQYEASLRHAPSKTGPQELALCQFFQTEVKNPIAAKRCQDQLMEQYSKSYFVRSPLKMNTQLTHSQNSQIAKDTTQKPSDSSSSETASEEATTTSAYCIQVGAFGSQENAHFLKENLSFLKKPILIQERKGNSGTLYLVRIQGFDSKSAAEGFAQNEVAPQGLTYRVYKN